ncbi:pilin [Pseudomonas entomophila]|uniref:pilin n=1 Tax=Pseudomonas sp. RIT-PI-S TaxID=3035295 RepID=UPI0021D8DB7D
MKKGSAGFSLIELLIVIATISILGAIAVPSYLRYIASAKATAGKAELGALQINFEGVLSTGNTTPSITDIGTPNSSTNCILSLTYNQDGTSVLACALINPPYLITGGIISYLRSPTGTWTCQVNAAIGATYAPNGCSVGG